MGRTGLHLRPVSAAVVEQARPENAQAVTTPTDGVCDLSRWQPDWVLVSTTLKRIAIVDLCRPSDVHPDQLSAAGIRKQQVYSPLVDALGYYSDQGWVIHVFPWVVGIRGLIDPVPIETLLKFLDIPQRHLQTALDRTALASVRALYFLHRARFGGRPVQSEPVLDIESCDREVEAVEATTLRKPRKRQKGKTAGHADHLSRTVHHDVEPHPRKRRRQNPLSNTAVQTDSDAAASSREARDIALAPQTVARTQTDSDAAVGPREGHTLAALTVPTTRTQIHLTDSTPRIGPREGNDLTARMSTTTGWDSEAAVGPRESTALAPVAIQASSPVLHPTSAPCLEHTPNHRREHLTITRANPAQDLARQHEDYDPSWIEAVHIDEVRTTGGNLYGQRHLTQRKRMRWGDDNSAFDTDDPGERTATRRAHVTGDQSDSLWTRWRQLDAGKRRRK